STPPPSSPPWMGGIARRSGCCSAPWQPATTCAFWRAIPTSRSCGTRQGSLRCSAPAVRLEREEMTMTVRGVVGCVVMSGLLGTLAACASGGSSTAAAPEAEAMSAKAAAASMTPAGQVLIQVSPDCTVDVAAAHISEAKKQEARWELTGNPGPLGIEFKEEKGKNALDVG